MIELHALFLLVFVGTNAFFSGLALVNLRYGARTLREEREWVADRLGLDDPERLIAYQRANTRLHLAETGVFVALVLAVLYSGVFANVVAWFDRLGYGPVVTGVAFFVALVVALEVASLPFDAYGTFVIEERFEFNQQSFGSFLRDATLGLAIAVAFTALLGAGVLWVIETFPAGWWLGALALFAAFSLAMLVIYPRIIAPLFNDFEPVESGDLHEAVLDVFERAGFTCEQIYVMDASRRSSHSNAYFVGFGRTKRVVLFDTLIDQMELEEIESVLAHELAHWKKRHIWKQFGAGVVHMGAVLFALWYLLQTAWLYDLFGAPTTVYAGLALAALWVLPLSRLTQPIENRLSLAHEREADAFATRVMGSGRPLIEALCRLTGENLSNPFPHPLYATFHYTHPPIPERIRSIREHETATNESASRAAAGE